MLRLSDKNPPGLVRADFCVFWGNLDLYVRHGEVTGHAAQIFSAERGKAEIEIAVCRLRRQRRLEAAPCFWTLLFGKCAVALDW